MEHRNQPLSPSNPERQRPINGHVGAPVRSTIRPPEPPEPALPAGVRRPPSPRRASTALGLWLFASAFLLPHADASRMHTWIVGALIAAAGLLELRAGAARIASTLLGVWLIGASFLFLPRAELTFWHNLAVGFVVLVLSFVPASASGGPRPGTGAGGGPPG